MQKRGWVRGEPIYLALPAVPEIEDFGKTHNLHLDLSLIKNDHLVKKQSKSLKILDNIAPHSKVGSLIMQGKDEKLAFVSFSNFVVITKYNTSAMYALAVAKIAEQINQLE